MPPRWPPCPAVRLTAAGLIGGLLTVLGPPQAARQRATLFPTVAAPRRGAAPVLRGCTLLPPTLEAEPQASAALADDRWTVRKEAF